MRMTSVTVQRASASTLTTLVTGLLVQIDQISEKEMVEARANYDFRGVDVFKLYTRGWYANTLLRRLDRLVDEQYVDPVTGSGLVYLVVSRPKDFDRSYQACLIQSVVGTT